MLQQTRSAAFLKGFDSSDDLRCKDSGQNGKCQFFPLPPRR